MTPNKSLQYNSTTGEASQFDKTNLPTNIQTQSTFIKQILLSGTYEYTQVSVTNPSQFNLTQITDKNQLLYAYPALSGQDNGTISEVSINGQYQNGVISRLNGQFNYTPPTENSTTKTYTFTLNLQRPLPPIEPPQWIQNTTNTTNTTNAL